MYNEDANRFFTYSFPTRWSTKYVRVQSFNRNLVSAVATFLRLTVAFRFNK
jgi:hypothetical protein